MPIIPIPIIVPDDGTDVILPDAVLYIMLGGLTTAIIGCVMALAAAIIEFAFDRDFDLILKIAAVLAVVGISAALIGLVLALITGETVQA